MTEPFRCPICGKIALMFVNTDSIRCSVHGEMSGIFVYQLEQARTTDEKIDYMAKSAIEEIREMTLEAMLRIGFSTRSAAG